MSETATPPPLIRFLFRATDARGAVMYVEVAHSSAVLAHDQLSAQGYSSVQLLEDGFDRELERVGVKPPAWVPNGAATRGMVKDQVMGPKSKWGDFKEIGWNLVASGILLHWMWRRA